MKNTLKLILITSATFFLFACDSSSTAKSTPAGNSYLISAKISGLNGNDTIKLFSGNEIKDFTKNGTQKFDIKISEGSKYNVGIITDPFGKICTVANGSGDKMTADVVADVTCAPKATNLTGNLTDGEIYYMSECAVCHQAGTTDPTKTFASSDVAENYKIAKGNGTTNIKPDMHAIGPTRNLMGRFDAIPAQSVADLEVYLLSVAP